MDHQLCKNGCGQPVETKEPGVPGSPFRYCSDKCRKEDKAKYRAIYRAEHKERLDRLDAEWRAKNKEQKAKYYIENKERETKHKTNWTAENKERIAENNAKRYAQNKEREVAKAAKYREEYPGCSSEYYNRNKKRIAKREATPQGKAIRLSYVHKRKARKRGVKSEPYTRQGVWNRDKGICGICNLPADPNKWHLDHIIPLGPGEDIFQNVQVTHPKCNLFKASEDKKIIAEWRKSLSIKMPSDAA
jgi:5-methylcytosine-specific restriction endonuclease McrA